MSDKLRQMLAILLLAMMAPLAQADDSPAVKAMAEYLDFVDYGGGIILPEQIPAGEWKNIYVIDARDAEQYGREHIPGAINVEWRQVLARRGELPNDRTILIYCNTGTLSSQAGFALRVAGMDNVRILQGGLSGWKAKGGFDAHLRATQPAKP